MPILKGTLPFLITAKSKGEYPRLVEGVSLALFLLSFPY